MLQDEPLLLDMFQAAQDAVGFDSDLTEPEFEASKLHQNAVIRSIEVIGEAAGKVSKGFRDAHPEIPWREIVGMRHRLIHDYTDLRLEIVWDVAKHRLSALIATLQPLVPAENPDPPDP